MALGGQQFSTTVASYAANGKGPAITANPFAAYFSSFSKRRQLLVCFQVRFVVFFVYARLRRARCKKLVEQAKQLKTDVPRRKNNRYNRFIGRILPDR